MVSPEFRNSRQDEDSHPDLTYAAGFSGAGWDITDGCQW